MNKIQIKLNVANDVINDISISTFHNYLCLKENWNCNDKFGIYLSKVNKVEWFDIDYLIFGY